MFDDYLYVSSTSQAFRDHFSKMADKFIKDFDLNEESFVVDIGSNDGVFLTPLKDKGIKILGVDPAKNLVDLWKPFRPVRGSRTPLYGDQDANIYQALIHIKP